MDPYIEGQGWRGFCTQFIAQLQRMLAPLVRQRYVVHTEEHVYLVRESGGDAREPDPEALVTERTHVAVPAASGAVLDAPVMLRLPQLPFERQRYLAIRCRDTGRIVCVIELLSPINKARGAGRQEYLAERVAVLQSAVHLVEVDLLRGGERLPMDDPLPPAEYYALVSRAEQRPDCGVWPIRLRDPLPPIPIPLGGDDAPVALDLQEAFDVVYDAAGYADILDYAHGTEPPLPAEETGWAEAVLEGVIGGG